MLNRIKIEVDLNCPNCGKDVNHQHEFKINSTLQEYKDYKLTAIGHTNPLIEDAINFFCIGCKCWHCIDIKPIEVHVFSGVKEEDCK